MTTIELHFNDALGQLRTVHALTTDGHGWHMSAALGGRAFSKHCGSWQGVEHTMSWLRRHAHEPAAQQPHRPRPPVPVWSVVAGLLLALIASSAPAQPVPAADPVAAFTAATREYALLHRRIEQRLGPIDISADPATIQRAIDSMAAAMRAERPSARQGELFTPAAAVVLRIRIAEALIEHGYSPWDVHAAERADGVDGLAIALRVNDTFPWKAGTAMFTCLREALPELPPELQYRIVGGTLVLIDVHASLVVDLLPNALADPRTTVR